MSQVSEDDNRGVGSKFTPRSSMLDLRNMATSIHAGYNANAGPGTRSIHHLASSPFSPSQRIFHPTYYYYSQNTPIPSQEVA